MMLLGVVAEEGEGEDGDEDEGRVGTWAREEASWSFHSSKRRERIERVEL